MGVTSPTIPSTPAAFSPCSFPTGGNPDAEIALQLAWRKYQGVNGGVLEETRIGIGC
jgi:hypothetical protein